jgi:HAD superfamily hydrolase (TIGR01490 family)
MRNAALFDLDGTLISNKSAEKTFFFHLLRRGVLTPWNLFQMTGVLWKFHFDFHAMVRGNKRYLRNKKVARFKQVAQTYFEPRISEMLFPNMRQVIEKHRDQGDLLLLLSGTLDVIGDCFIRELGFDGGKAGVLEIRDGKYTGRIEGILPYGLGKLEVLRELREEHQFDQNHTTLYANIYSDRYVMNAVQTPIAVNPDDRLRAYALRRKWDIIEVT